MRVACPAAGSQTIHFRSTIRAIWATVSRTSARLIVCPDARSSPSDAHERSGILVRISSAAMSRPAHQCQLREFSRLPSQIARFRLVRSHVEPE